MALSDADRALLDFEQLRFKYAGTKEQQIRERFGMTTTAYFRRLNELIDMDDAALEFPLLVRRLRRVRDDRVRRKAAKRLGIES